MFRNIHGHAGEFRLVRVRIAGTRHEPPRPEEMPLRLEEWEKEYRKRDLSGEDPISLGAWLHWRFEAVHPFQDGSGRIGRLLLNHHLLRKNWPPAHVLPSDRDEYLAALDAGNRSDLAPMERFLEGALARSLLDLLDQVGTKEDELRSLAELERSGPYDAKYLALRASQGALPAIKLAKEWRTSRRAVGVYREQRGRG